MTPSAARHDATEYALKACRGIQEGSLVAMVFERGLKMFEACTAALGRPAVWPACVTPVASLLSGCLGRLSGLFRPASYCPAFLWPRGSPCSEGAGRSSNRRGNRRPVRMVSWLLFAFAHL